MNPKRPRPTRRTTSARLRPGQDMLVARKQAAQFPTVGMTLKSYKYDPRDRHKRAGRPVIVKRSRWQAATERLSLKKFVVTLLVAFLLIGGFVGGKFLWNAHKLFGGSLFGVLSSTKLDGEDIGRVNILLAGNSADDVGHSGGQLTDSIMLVSIDTRNNKAFLLSIPRDLLVTTDHGDSYQKINSVYVDGGMGELKKVVSQDLGVPINYYALIDYNALQQAVNAVGGVDITIKSDDPRGIYDPNIDWSTHKPLVKLSNGPHHLNGRQALDLARARGDAWNSYGFAGSDFTRTEHQRQLLVALKNKAVSANVLANPARLTELSDAIGNNVHTDMKLNEVKRLYEVTKPIGSRNITSLSLNDADGQNLLTSYSSRTVGSALVPAAGMDDFSDIRAFIRRQTSSNPVVQENAAVVVLNAAGTNGLASKKRTAFESKNLRVMHIDDASTTQPTSTIIDASGGSKPATLGLLKRLLGGTVTTTSANPYSRVYPDADFIVLLGSDQVPQPAAGGQ